MSGQVWFNFKNHKGFVTHYFPQTFELLLFTFRDEF